MRVAIDLSCVARPGRTGIGWYATRLVEEFAALQPGHTFDLCYRASRWRKRRYFLPLPGPSFHQRILWPDPVHTIWGRGWEVFHGPDARLPQVRCRRVVTVHDLFNLVSSDFSDPAFIERKRSQYRQLVERADLIIADSHSTRDDIIHHLQVPEERLRVVHLGVDHKRFRPPSSEALNACRKRTNLKRPYLLFVGNITKRKNTARMVEAFARLPGAIRRDLDFVFVGDMAYGGEELMAAARRLGIEDHIQTIGYATMDDLPLLYGGAEGFIFTTLYEGFGLPVLEAMACGCPVLTSPLSSLPEVGGEVALYADPLDVDAIADQLELLLESGPVRERRVQDGIDHAASFTWRRTAEATLRVYEELV